MSNSEEMYFCEIKSLTGDQEPHSHGSGKIIILLEGNIRVHTAGKTLRFDKKRLLYIPPGVMHKLDVSPDNSCMVLDIPKNILIGTSLLNVQAAALYPCDDKWDAVIHLMTYEILSGKNNATALYCLLKYGVSLISSKSESASISYIRQHFEQALSIAELAKMEHFNTAYYSQWFFKQTGMTPTDYIQALRIEKAKELLDLTDYSVTEVSAMVGYSHQTSFTRFFKRIEGISPLEFRRRMAAMYQRGVEAYMTDPNE